MTVTPRHRWTDTGSHHHRVRGGAGGDPVDFDDDSSDPATPPPGGYEPADPADTAAWAEASWTRGPDLADQGAVYGDVLDTSDLAELTVISDSQLSGFCADRYEQGHAAAHIPTAAAGDLGRHGRSTMLADLHRPGSF